MILVCRIWGLSGLRFRNLFVWLSLASSRATMLEPIEYLWVDVS